MLFLFFNIENDTLNAETTLMKHYDKQIISIFSFNFKFGGEK